MSAEPPFAQPVPLKHHRVEVAPISPEIADYLDRCLAEGWELRSMTTVQVTTEPPTPLKPNPPKVLGLMLIFRPCGRHIASAGQDERDEGQALAVLESLHSTVKASMPFVRLEGLLRDKLDQIMAATENFLTANGC